MSVFQKFACHISGAFTSGKKTVEKFVGKLQTGQGKF